MSATVATLARPTSTTSARSAEASVTGPCGSSSATPGARRSWSSGVEVGSNGHSSISSGWWR
ncbi:hypothetical protein GS446_25135 [Rhodococcus hoagii]|nr:hypothetical protein [Prescottella equi]